MIATLTGILKQVYNTYAIIDVRGVGYIVHMSNHTISRIPAKETELTVHTHMQVSEAGVNLYGFLTSEELKMFGLLISVSGVGPKVASAVLGTLSPQDIILAIVAEDAAQLSKAPGIGKKTAERLVLELRDKIKTSDAWVTGGVQSKVATDAKQEAMDALLALGYGRSEAMQAILEDAEANMTTSDILRLALKKLAR